MQETVQSSHMEIHTLPNFTNQQITATASHSLDNRSQQPIGISIDSKPVAINFRPTTLRANWQKIQNTQNAVLRMSRNEDYPHQAQYLKKKKRSLVAEEQSLSTPESFNIDATKIRMVQNT